MIDNQLNCVVEELEPDLMPGIISGFIRKLQIVLEKRKQSNIGLPKGKVYISPRKKRPQFYMADSWNMKKKQYLNTMLTPVATQYIQQEYNEKVISALEWEIAWLSKYLKMTGKKGIAEIHKLMCRSKKRYYHPVTLEDEVYRQKWGDRQYKGKAFQDGDNVYETSFNLRVRSKSEIIIAEALRNSGIPFLYEYPLTINEKTYYPDFLCLNVRTRKTYVWEHFGKMDDAGYVSGRMSKLLDYEEEGLVSGKNLIITEEDRLHPLTAAAVDERISLFLI